MKVHYIASITHEELVAHQGQFMYAEQERSIEEYLSKKPFSGSRHYHSEQLSPKRIKETGLIYVGPVNDMLVALMKCYEKDHTIRAGRIEQRMKDSHYFEVTQYHLQKREYTFYS